MLGNSNKFELRINTGARGERGAVQSAFSPRSPVNQLNSNAYGMKGVHYVNYLYDI